MNATEITKSHVYRKKSSEKSRMLLGLQWKNKGDYPEMVELCIIPEDKKNLRCGMCGKSYSTHGLVKKAPREDYLICPDGYIAVSNDGDYMVIQQEIFENTYGLCTSDDDLKVVDESMDVFQQLYDMAVRKRNNLYYLNHSKNMILPGLEGNTAVTVKDTMRIKV